MPEQNDAPLVRKGYLYLLPVILAVLVLNLLFNQDARNLVGLKPGKTLSLKGLLGGKQVVAAPVAAPAKPLTFSAEDVRAFTESFTKREVRVMVIPPPPPPPPPPPSTNEVGKSGGSKPPPPPPPPPDVPWPVPVQGTFQDRQGRWTAIIAGQYCRAGKQLVSAQTNRCAYTVLWVGRRCVWLHAYRSDKPEPPVLPDIEWPDVSLIETVREGLIKRSYVPTRLRLANGVTAKKEDTLAYATTKVRFTVKELWETGVVFEAKKDDQSAKIACMLVSPP